MPGSAPRPDALGRVLSGARGLMSMDDRAWARHASPWSVWTRIATPLPMLALSVWSRVWIGWWCLLPVALTLAWVWWNPRAFPPPRRFESWASRGVLAERAVIAHRGCVAPHHRRAMAALTAASAAGLAPYAWGLWAFEPWAVAAGIVLVTGAKLWFVDRCIWAAEDLERSGAPSPSEAPSTSPSG